MAQKPPAAKVAKFKEFAKEHPGLVEEVRNQKRSWQDIYEEWDIYGEDANLWKQYRASDAVKQAASSRNAGGGGSRPGPKQGSSQNKGGLNLGSLFSLLEKIDFDQFQKGLSQASGALDTIQKLMGQSQNQNQNSSTGGMNPYGNGQQGQYGNGVPGPYGNRPPSPYWNGAPGGYGNGMPGPYGYNNMQGNMQGPPQGYGPPRQNGYGPYPPQNPPQNNNGNNMNNGQDGNNNNNGS